MNELKETMEECCGVFRNKERVTKGLNKVKELKERFPRITLTDKSDYYNTELPGLIELRNMLDISEAILMGAVERTESRGSHCRTGFPDRDDKNWLKHTLITKEDGRYKLGYREVTITKFQPEERKY